MKKIILFFTCLIFTGNLVGQSNLEIGEKTPPIHITHWVDNKPTDIDLKGQFIVLEFWATWCGPCIAEVPHLNALQKAINVPNAMFISMTDESVKKIKRTLSKVGFKSIVVSDTTGQTQINFGDGKSGLEEYPMTVLIDDKGIVQWVGEPRLLTKKVINDFLAGKLKGEHHFKKKSTVKKTLTTNSDLEQDNFTWFKEVVQDSSNLFFLNFKEVPATTYQNTMTMGTNWFLDGVNLKKLYELVFDEKIVAVDTAKYCLMYKNTDKKLSRDMLETMILNTLNLKKQSKKVEIKQGIVSISDESFLEPTLESLFSSMSEAGDKIIFSNYTIAQMVEHIAGLLGVEMIYSGDNRKGYDFIMNVDNYDNFRASLKAYGLSVEQVKKKVERTYLLNR